MKVLHIDDNSGFLDLTKAFLESEVPATDIDTATGPEAGLEALEENTYHCVVSDYDMPGHNGLELLKRVREEYPDLPFILYTGKGSEEIAAEAINAGVTGYFQKGGPDQHRRLANRIEHAATEHRARIESERYSTVLRALGYPIYVVNENAEFEYVNGAFLELTGYEREEVIGSGPGLIKSESGTERADEMLAGIVSETGPNTQQFRVDIRTKDGEIVPCHDHMAALPFGEEFRGSVGILRDISAQKQTREELIRQNERLEEFVSIVSHDLRAPINNAKTAASLAESTGDAAHFEQLAAEHDRMEEMIDELLTLAREGETVAETEPVRLAPLVEDCWEPFCCAEDAIRLALDEDVTVEAERSRLRRLVENLLRNSVEHGASPVTVTVGELDDGGFYVSDDGPGIAPEDRDDVFEPGVTSEEDGTGFGLTIVKRIADAHGWDVTVSESDDGGVRFGFVTAEDPFAAPERAVSTERA
ncbi:ATP-binding protein [Natronomonas sp.]|uniref:hybrid sensor histidine kinase/response regulator n=1 Tax=Natronomonas sp. TaxID=2184060 RepID=UPI002612C42B|nr:ATP-binding protein [Natronomonas sp.]